MGLLQVSLLVVAASFLPGRNAQMDMTPIVNGIEVSCDADRMRIYVDSARPFRGRVYPKGFFKQEDCVTSFDGSQDVTIVDLEFNSIDQCGMVMEQGDSQTTFGSVVVVQPHNKLVTMMSRAFQVRCTYDYRGSRLTESGFTGVVSDGFNVSMLGTVWEDTAPGLQLRVLEDGVSPVNATAAPPSATMSIYLTDSNLEADKVNIGELLEMRVTLAGERAAQMYGIYVRSCTVSDGMGMDSQMLIDQDGCPVEAAVFPHFSYNEDYTQALALYKSHKFPYTSQVQYVCYVDFCLKMNGGCDGFRDRALTLEAGACPRGVGGGAEVASARVARVQPAEGVEIEVETVARDDESEESHRARRSNGFNIQNFINSQLRSLQRSKRQAPTVELPQQQPSTTPSSVVLPQSVSLHRALIVVDEAEVIDRSGNRLTHQDPQPALSCMSGPMMTGMFVLVGALAIITLVSMLMLVYVVSKRGSGQQAYPSYPPAYPAQKC